MLIDLSHTLENCTFPFPGDLPFRLEQVASIGVDGYNNYSMHSGMHIGTHVDGVGHMIDHAQKIGQVPLERFFGEVIVLNYEGALILDFTADLESLDLKDKIVLCFTGHDSQWGSAGYFTQHPIMTERLANWLVCEKVKMVGIDFPSPDVEPYGVHKHLLNNNIHILENLTQLEKLVGLSAMTLMAFPLKLNADSSPVRAVVSLPANVGE